VLIVSLCSAFNLVGKRQTFVSDLEPKMFDTFVIGPLSQPAAFGYQPPQSAPFALPNRHFRPTGYINAASKSYI
jgi:hypothetical protein